VEKISFLSPRFPDVNEVKEDLEKIYESNWYTNSGPYEQSLAKGIEEYIGSGVRVSILSNATVALMMAIKHLCKPGREKVIMPSFTFAAGAHAIVWAGYVPIFADIDRGSWQMDIVSVEKYLEKNHLKVAGVLLCNVFGAPVENIEEWEALAKKYDLPLIIDSAAGMGSEYPNGEKMGCRGDCEIFSFHATKPFGIGEGGAIVSKNDKLINDFNQMKNFGFGPGRSSEMLGLNAKVPEITCAIGVRVLEKFAERLVVRRNILKKYKEMLKGKPVRFLQNDNLSTIAFVCIQVDGERDKMLSEFADKQIEVKKYYYPPVHMHSLFSKYDSISSLSNTDYISSTIISLPMHEDLNDDDITRIVTVINNNLIDA
jgi:dTDP-4-amino-4,6-dideoxygalactose transaminase